ncbi:BamA/TamA family outer membrane protein [Sediminibacterium ginsengisoli]|uniref:BamA/TamA family outer membrane protein n=1 Tax=Sediminibacterium ginsengisoli TaxID=413434 RepID=UPI001590A17B|nr:BamA/TamA family outer membrane protein [Sediminibacterium ginsengisoli]
MRNYPAGQPFVYESKVVLNGDLAKDEKNRLTTELDNYWDDSLKARKLQQFGFFYRIKNPPVFDTANIARSVNYMNAFLHSQGYYYASFSDTVRIDTVKDQMRTNITMYIDAGKNTTIDSVSANLGDSTLQKITDENRKNTLLKKGAPYTKQTISSELDRLVGLYRQNGYYGFTRDDIYALVDSTDISLLTLTIDPFKQAQLIADAAKRRKENPAWDISILTRPVTDSSVVTQYHIGHLYYFPETRLSDNTDSLIAHHEGMQRQDFSRSQATMFYRKGSFRYRPMREHSYIKNKELFNEELYLKSLSTLGQIGAWQQVDAIPRVRGKDSLDIYFFLTPAVKQSFTVDLEGSRNTSEVLFGNTWGVSTNFSYHNKNVWKQAIQSVTTLRTGVELSIFSQNNTGGLAQSFLTSLSHTYVFPRLIQPFKNWRALNQLENKRTLVSINGSYVNRKYFYELRSLVFGWGYEWKTKRGMGDNIWLYKPLNLELYGLDKLDSLKSLIAKNPFLTSSFNEGNVLSQSFSLIRTSISPNNKNKTHYFRLGIEEAGGLFGLIPGLRDNIYRYIKAEAEYRQSIKFPHAELAYRGFAGVGYNYGTDPVIGNTLPFFKQFTAGGPYSMRAWGLRQLGLGSSIRNDTISTTTYRDRFGDMQLEANFEYRFPLATIAGFKVTSALYTDIGNVWNVKSRGATDPDPSSRFSFKNIGKDLAIGVGTGVRIDFSYVLLRLDFAYKVKDPARLQNGGWMSIKNFEWTENRQNGLKVDNYAFQFGIGLPF